MIKRWIMDWLQKRRDHKAHTSSVLTKVDRTLTEAPDLIELYRRRLEVLTGQAVDKSLLAKEVPREKT